MINQKVNKMLESEEIESFYESWKNRHGLGEELDVIAKSLNFEFLIPTVAKIPQSNDELIAVGLTRIIFRNLVLERLSQVLS